MREIREVKANVKFFKFTGLLTDIPEWFWNIGYSISRENEDEWKICLGNAVSIYVSFGEYVLYNEYFDDVTAVDEILLREDFDVIE